METMFCPKCGSQNIDVQVFQEVQGSKTKMRMKEKGHGCLYWAFGGWFIDLLSWILFFFPRVLLHIGRRKKYKGSEKTTNKINYTSCYICKNCGHHWER